MFGMVEKKNEITNRYWLSTVYTLKILERLKSQVRRQVVSLQSFE